MKMEIPKLKEEIGKGERYFTIMDTDSKSCGEYQIFCVSPDTTEEEIFKVACTLHTETMLKKEQSHVAGLFRAAPKWRNKLKVAEESRTVTDPTPHALSRGKDYSVIWKIKKDGLHFEIYLWSLKATFRNGDKLEQKEYRFSKKLDKPPKK